MDGARLFEPGVASGEWSQFNAAGFDIPVSGLVTRTNKTPCCGVPLGGLGTGCLDVGAHGTLGYMTCFPTRRRKPVGRYQPSYREAVVERPFLGIAVGGQTWVCATADRLKGGRIQGCVEPGMNRELLDDPSWLEAWSAEIPVVVGVEPATEIEYWGHYPVVDMEYSTTCPVGIGLRAWSPFIPGDKVASNTPAAIFEVHLRNATDDGVRGTMAFSFPGPPEDATEQPYRYHRTLVQQGGLRGVYVSSSGGELSYVLAAIDEHEAEAGPELAGESTGWASTGAPAPWSIAAGPTKDAGASVRVPFEVAAHSNHVVTVLLAWHASSWVGGHYSDILGFESWDIGPHVPPGRDKQHGETYVPRYMSRYANALEVALDVAHKGPDWLARVLAWQSSVYATGQYPEWLKDALINSLSVITEDSYWAQPSQIFGDWANNDGAFGLIESPRGCAIMGCVVSNWYGDIPLAYFFPDLERAILRNYAAYVRPDGAVPFLFPNADFTMPTYEWLLPLNGVCFIGLVDRLWRITGDDTVLTEFYDVVKTNTQFTMTLVPPPAGVISVHRIGTGQEWWEHTPVQGMVTHVAGLRLASLQIAARMADAVGDNAFSAQSAAWFRDGQRLAEGSLWMDDASSYMFFSGPGGERSDDILSSQLDGEWSSFAHGFDGVFDPDRVARVLTTIDRSCNGPYAVMGFATKAGVPDAASTVTFSRQGVPEGDTAYGTFTAESDIIGMTFMYHGRTDTGMEIVRRTADNMIRKEGHGWDLPNMVRGSDGKRNFGTDYFQKLSIWGVPAALASQPIEGPARRVG